MAYNMAYKKKALITARFTPEGREILADMLDITRAGYGVGGELLPDADFAAMAAGVEVLVVELQQVTKAVIDAATRLEVIASCRGTPGNVDVGAATARGIPVLYTPGRNAVSVAEAALALMLNLARNIFPAVCSLRGGEWGSGSESPFIRFRGVELYGKTIGIVGFGAVGRELAKRAVALGMRLLVTDPYVPADAVEEAGGVGVSLDELLAVSDFVSLHAKVTAETRGMIGGPQFAMMKQTAYLINTAGGLLVDEGALLNALRERRIAGAGLDVFAVEPLPAGHPLLDMGNVIATPHVGGATSDVSYHQSVMVAEDIRRYLSGQRPEAVYNPEVLG